jgi:hypothetical protein
VTARRLLIRLLGVCVAIAGCATAPAPAAASFGIHSLEESFEQAPPAGSEHGPLDLQAGSHPYQFTTNFTFNTTKDAGGETFPDEAVKDVNIELPPGLVGNPNVVPQCSAVVFGSDTFGSANCPSDTQLGTITFEATYLEFTAKIYNLKPPPGVAVAFGVAGVVPIIMDVAVRDTRDYGSTVNIRDVSEAAPLTGMALTLSGDPNSAPEAFLTMPTSCGEPLATTVTADSWEHPTTLVQRSVTTLGADGAPSALSGCGRLPFEPTVTVQPESSAADTPTGLSIDVDVPYLNDAEGLAEASVKNFSIALPSGVSINPAAAGGLAGCSTAQIGLGQASPASCPPASKVGVFAIDTPVLAKALRGSIYLAQQSGGVFEGSTTMYLVSEEGAIQLKIPGQLSAQPGSGQLTLTLSNLPELPLSDMELELFGGGRATLATPSVCGTFTTTATLTPYSAPESGAPATRSSAFTLSENCGGGFAPSLLAGATNAAAGQVSGFALRVGRTDGQEYIQRLTTTLPPGLLAHVSSVAQCGEADATAGTCPASSEVGTVEVAAGAGSDPYYLKGPIYLTGPYAGAPFGVSMVIPAAAGPFDLGTVVIRGAIAVDLAAGSMTITTNPLPISLQGIPLRAKGIDLDIDRSGFMVNPTSCAGSSIGDTVSSTGGAQATASVPFRVVGCAGLPFEPRLRATTLARASSRGNGASLDVKVTSGAGPHADLESVAIELPKALKARLGAVQGACPAATYAVNPGRCPPTSAVGSAAVDSPLLGTPLSGPVYLVYHRGTKYPNVEMVLQGSGMELQLAGSVNIAKGITRTAFTQLPDIPLTLFELSLPKGSHSMLGAIGGLCAKPLSLPFTMSGQNGAQSRGSTTIAVEGCRARGAKRSRQGRTQASRAARSLRQGDRRGR